MDPTQYLPIISLYTLPFTLNSKKKKIHLNQIPEKKKKKMYYGDGENCKSYSEMEVSSSGGGGGGGGEYETTESLRKGAQQTEESYQLQLALAVRLSAQASCGHDPNFLVSSSHHHHHHRGTLSSSVSAEALSHRFWVGINAIFASLSVNGCNFCYSVLLAYVIRNRI